MTVKHSLIEVIERIVEINSGIERFWKDGGWAPPEAASLLAQSRLDLQVSFSHSLKALVKIPPPAQADATLILGWAALGSLFEGTMKFFLSVHLSDYKNNPMLDYKNNMVPPEEMMLEKLKQFFSRTVWSDDQRNRFRPLVEKVQQRRNAIHSFGDRDIGDRRDFRRCIRAYLEFLEDMHAQIPYP